MGGEASPLLPPFIGLLAMALILVLVIVGKNAGWWLQQQDIKHGYSNTVSSQGYQSSLIQEMQGKLQDISDTGVTRAGEPASSPMQASQRAQQLAALRTFCHDGSQLTAGNPAASQLYPIYDRNCLAGTVAPSPLLCLSKTGKPQPNYWEGPVHALPGTASWNSSTHSIVPSGPDVLPVCTLTGSGKDAHYHCVLPPAALAQLHK